MNHSHLRSSLRASLQQLHASLPLALPVSQVGRWGVSVVGQCGALSVDGTQGNRTNPFTTFNQGIFGLPPFSICQEKTRTSLSSSLRSFRCLLFISLTWANGMIAMAEDDEPAASRSLDFLLLPPHAVQRLISTTAALAESNASLRHRLTRLAKHLADVHHHHASVAMAPRGAPHPSGGRPLGRMRGAFGDAAPVDVDESPPSDVSSFALLAKQRLLRFVSGDEESDLPHRQHDAADSGPPVALSSGGPSSSQTIAELADAMTLLSDACDAEIAAAHRDAVPPPLIPSSSLSSSCANAGAMSRWEALRGCMMARLTLPVTETTAESAGVNQMGPMHRASEVDDDDFEALMFGSAPTTSHHRRALSEDDAKDASARVGVHETSTTMLLQPLTQRAYDALATVTSHREAGAASTAGRDAPPAISSAWDSCLSAASPSAAEVALLVELCALRGHVAALQSASDKLHASADTSIDVPQRKAHHNRVPCEGVAAIANVVNGPLSVTHDDVTSQLQEAYDASQEHLRVTLERLAVESELRRETTDRTNLLQRLVDDSRAAMAQYGTSVRVLEMENDSLREAACEGRALEAKLAVANGELQAAYRTMQSMRCVAARLSRQTEVATNSAYAWSVNGARLAKSVCFLEACLASHHRNRLPCDKKVTAGFEPMVADVQTAVIALSAAAADDAPSPPASSTMIDRHSYVRLVAERDELIAARAADRRKADASLRDMQSMITALTQQRNALQAALDAATAADSAVPWHRGGARTDDLVQEEPPAVGDSDHAGGEEGGVPKRPLVVPSLAGGGKCAAAALIPSPTSAETDNRSVNHSPSKAHPGGLEPAGTPHVDDRQRVAERPKSNGSLLLGWGPLRLFRRGDADRKKQQMRSVTANGADTGPPPSSVSPPQRLVEAILRENMELREENHRLRHSSSLLRDA